MLRLSDLIGCRVVDETGKSWGKVHDVHIEALRLQGLAAGKGSLWTRLGFPARNATYVPWEAVIAIEETVIRVRARSLRR